MSEKKTGLAAKAKAIYFSIRDALAYRQIDRDPGNRDATMNNRDYGLGAAPRVDRAIQLSTIWACVRLISNAIATMPLFMYERTEVNGVESRRLARDHPLFTLLKASPNADMTAFEFKRFMSIQLLTWGNFYVLKVRGRGGKIVSLEPLHAAQMTVRRNSVGAREYVYSENGKPKTYTEDDVWHLMGYTEDGLVGLSPIAVGCRSIIRATNIEDAASRTFGGNMRPTGVVSIAEILNEKQRPQMQSVIEQGVFGNQQMGYVHLLEGGAKFQQLTINPVDAQMLEQANASVEDLCRWFGVPPSKIGHGTAVSNWGTGREQQNLGFLQEVLDPDLTMVEESIEKFLLPPAERGRFYAEFGREKLLSMDSASRASFYDKMIKAGVYTPNFCRGLENQEPIDGGDQLFMQSNMIPLNMVGKITSTAQSDTIEQENEGDENEIPN